MPRRGSYWKDPERAQRAIQAMRDNWKMRRFFIVEKEGKKVECATVGEVADMVGRSEQTVKVYLARGKGKYTLMHDGNLVTLRRVVRGDHD